MVDSSGVNWALGLQQGPDPGQRFMQAYEQGTKRREENEQRQAMAALAQNPDDPAAFRALAARNPQIAMQFRQQREQSKAQALEAHRENIVNGAKIIRQFQPKDQAGWDRVRQVAAQAGIDISEVPPQFDPQYVQGVVSLADAFAPQKAEGQPNIAKEVDYYRSIGRDDLAQQLLQRHAEGGPIVANNGDGTFTIVPRSMVGQPQQQAPQGPIPPPPPGFVIDGGPTPPASGPFQP